MLSRILSTRPRVEAAMSALDKGRLKLPVLLPQFLYEDFDKHPVTLVKVPLGRWSSPVADTVMLAKLVSCLRPKRLLEVGSYRGYTAMMLARHTEVDAKIVAFDRDARHGEAYRGNDLGTKIERRVGEMHSDAFACDPPRSYDFIFLDADHRYDAVKRDTEILLPLLAQNGLFVWHDYANWGRFSKTNGVPEWLHELSRDLPVVSICGSWLAAHSPAWNSGEEQVAFAAACVGSASAVGSDVWTDGSIRG